MTNSHDSFSSTIAATNSNLTRLSKVVGSTAQTLVSSQYGDLNNTHYQQAMKDITSRPAFRKRLFTFSKRAPSEVVRSSMSRSNEIEYRLRTSIPDEMLNDIPEESSNISLFQGFSAIRENERITRRHDNDSQLLNGQTKLVKGPESRVRNTQEAERLLDLLEIRKQLAANEIQEIDERISHLKGMRTVVFDRVAELEKQELEIEQIRAKLQDERQNTEKHKKNTEEDTEDRVKSVLHRHGNNRRKTMPTLQQYYEPGNKISVIEAHDEPITQLSFDIPFGTLVSASRDKVAKVWDLSNQQLLGTLEGHEATVNCLQMVDNIVITGSADFTAKIWDVGNLEAPLVETFASHVDEITCIHFSESTLVTGSEDKTIRQWDAITGKCVQTLDVVWAAAQTATEIYLDGPNSEPANGNSKIAVADALYRKTSSSASFVGAVQCFDAALASGTADGLIRLWDLRSGQVHRTLLGHTGPVTCLHFDDVHLVTGSMDRSIRIWDLRTGTISDAFAYENPITSLHFDARRIVSSNQENTVKIYDRENGKHWSCGPGEEDVNASIVNFACYKEGYVVEGRADGQIGCWAC